MRKLKVTPYPYQAEGIRYGLEKKRLLIGDEPGLGKTLQSIGIVHSAGAYPSLVICPSSLKYNWQREVEKFTDARALILDDSVRSTWSYLLGVGMYQTAIVNYESLRKFFVWDIRSTSKKFRLADVVFHPFIQQFRSVIIDESHRVKDPSTQQAIFTKGITTGKEYIIMLSGTPVVNRPNDLISQLSILSQLSLFGGRSQFVADYCFDAKTQDAPARPLSQLSDTLYRHCMIRREKAKVLPQLPEKTRVELIVDISNRAEYALAEDDLREYLHQYTEATDAEIRRKLRMEALVKFMTLRSLATRGKLQQAIEFVDNFLQSGRKLILFCALHEIVDELRSRYPESLAITGRESAAEKQAAVDQFQQNEQRPLIICSIKAAGVGLTLTASSAVAFLELPWTYADCCQCEDRAHRIGQPDNVTCYYLLARGTIDTYVHQLIKDKANTAAQILSAEDNIPSDKLYFDQLTQLFLNP